MSLFREIKEDIWAANDFVGVGLKKALSVMLFHHGFQLLLIYRVYHRLYKFTLLVPFARILWWISNVVYSCDINCKALLAGGVSLPHAKAIIIGEGVCVGRRVTIYQSVTLGQQSKEKKGYPKIGEGVTIGAGAQVLGKIEIGIDVTIGANAVVTKSVPDKATVIGVNGFVV